MALVKAKTVADERPLTYDNPIASKIQRRRYQILVHSLLYYELDLSLIPDSQWASWALELVALQADNPDIANRVIFAEAFKGFDGSTGFNLPYKDEQVITIAKRLLTGRRTAESEEALYKLNRQVDVVGNEWNRYKTKSHVDKPTTVKKEVPKVEQKQRKGLFSVPRA